LAPVTLATRADEAGGPPSNFYENPDNLEAERAGHKKIKLSVSLKMSIKTVSRSVEIKL